MARSAKQVLEEAMLLSEDERGELVRDLLDSFGVPPSQVEPPEKEWLAEIERRARRVLAGEPGIPWEDVRSAIRQRLAGR
jgi:putative addiction module component (TIGR02574 family)